MDDDDPAIIFQPDHIPQPLLPGLPDAVARICLAGIHPAILFSVCRSWRRLIYSPNFPPFLALYALVWSDSGDSLYFISFDPIRGYWIRLPPLPPELHLRPLLRHPSFLSRFFPIQSVSAGGKLIVLAATTGDFLPAVPSPLVFSPLLRQWTMAPALCYPRRWCVAGCVAGSVFVASGMGSGFRDDVARSVERLDAKGWKKMRCLRDAKFSREAVDGVGWRGRLCVVSVRAKEGALYDVDRDSWEAMPDGMISGWRGPAASMNEEIIYCVNESEGRIRRYDPERDRWIDVARSDRLRNAEQMSAGGGRLCVVCAGEIFIVDVKASPARIWKVELPLGFEAVAVHVLPRMTMTWL